MHDPRVNFLKNIKLHVAESVGDFKKRGNMIVLAYKTWVNNSRCHSTVIQQIKGHFWEKNDFCNI